MLTLWLQYIILAGHGSIDLDNLHLAVFHGLDSDKDRTARAMGLCRNLVNTFNLSWLKKRDLRKAQTETNVPQHNLVLVSDDNLLYNTKYLKG